MNINNYFYFTFDEIFSLSKSDLKLFKLKARYAQLFVQVYQLLRLSFFTTVMKKRHTIPVMKKRVYEYILMGMSKAFQPPPNFDTGS